MTTVPNSALLALAAVAVIALPLLWVGERWGQHHRAAKWIGTLGLLFAGAFLTGVLAGFMTWVKE